MTTEKFTWCVGCGEFREGSGACPVCGNSRRGFGEVRRLQGDTREDLKGDGREVAHSMTLIENKARRGRE